MRPTLQPEVAIVGASLGGVLAAWRAAASGRQVLLACEHPWLGGQMTAQAVPPDEHPLIETGGASASYLAFREHIRRLYRRQPGFRDRARLTPGTNPGDGWVSRLCFEPAHAARRFEALLKPWVERGQLRLLRQVRPVGAVCRGRRLESVWLEGDDGRAREVRASLFIDATDTGELLRLSDLPYRLGKESRTEFGEPDAPARADPLDQQPVTHVFALRRCDRPGPVIPAPPAYAFWSERVLPGYGHRQFSTALPSALAGRSAQLPLEVNDEASPTLDWWRYRRVVSAHQWDDGRADITLVNWAQNDYALHPLLDGPLPEREVQAAARDLSLCLLHWLQTQAPRADGGQGLAHWQPATDVLGTADGWAQQVYIRESRRIVACTTLTQSQLLHSGPSRADSVGIGWYNLDIHPTCRSGVGVNAPVQPFELPLGSFVPQDVDNLLPGCKNLGVTHLVNACSRVHPVEWLVGEVAGLLAAWLVEQHLTPQALLGDATQVQRFRQRLQTVGIPLAWPAWLLARRAPAH